LVIIGAFSIACGDDDGSGGSQAAPEPTPDPVAQQLAAVKAATTRYENVNTALADGYAAGAACDQIPAGSMGVHYANMSLLQDPALDITKPEVLMYLPDAQGNLKLIGVEWVKWDADQDLATSSDRPTLFGKPFDGPMEGHFPGMPRHYDLHLWNYADNPSGMFAQWNPALKCPGVATGAVGE
jgi:hypothetical protein